MLKLERRYIVIDTETTGLIPAIDKVFEVACVNVFFNEETRLFTVDKKNYFSKMINPCQSISSRSKEITNVVENDLMLCPTFTEIVDDLSSFLERGTYFVMHNAPFDKTFINCEIKSASRNFSLKDDNVIDTLQWARKVYGSYLTLTNLAILLEVPKELIDKRQLEGHSALLDAMILSEVFIKMMFHYELNRSIVF